MEGPRHSAGQSHHSLLLAEVNDRIFEVLSELGNEDGEFEDGEFLCECSDAGCIETIQLTLREYAALQAQPDRLPLKLSGHPD
jgi:hypothetical protein